MTGWVFDDGGRRAAGFLVDDVGDCTVRAIAIAGGIAYTDVRREIAAAMDRAWLDAAVPYRYVYPEHGVPRHLTRRYLLARGWTWTATLRPRSTARTYLHADQLPTGPLVVRMWQHAAAVVDGVVRDTWDCTGRCIYGYWTPPTAASTDTARTDTRRTA